MLGVNEQNTPLYAIGVVAEMLGVHPETLRVWEREGLVIPARRGRQRYYSNRDLKRVSFVHTLINQKGLNFAGVRELIAVYPCWRSVDCPGGERRSPDPGTHVRPCWQEQGSYCTAISDKADLCASCEHRTKCGSCPQELKAVRMS